jgi:CubicO group peptidase (beta-lactamase class C family)
VRLPAKTAGRYKKGVLAMPRFLISVFGLLVLIGSGWVFAESDTATLESVIAKYRADVLLASGGSVETSPLFMSQAERRIAFAHFDVLFPTRVIRSSGEASPLPSAPVDLSSVRFTANEKDMALGELFDSEHLMGLLVVQDGKVLMEHYAPDHGAEVPWVTFSVTKSVTSLLIGVAIHDGYIDSVTDPIVKYLPRLAGSEYGESSVQDILQMASGIAWNEDYEDPESDVARAAALNGVALTDYLAQLPRVASPGTRFNYNTAESNLLGEVLRSAIGMNAAPYLSQKIWQPMGMESDANWLLSLPEDRETGGCCISATLRDYARLGLLALADGVLPDGTRVLPEEWMAASTTPSQGYEGYGYKWWLDEDGRYGAYGIFGQTIAVDPKAKLVIAVHSNAQAASGSAYSQELEAALAAISEHLR